jgi:AcrR family transcriptional regulator
MRSKTRAPAPPAAESPAIRGETKARILEAAYQRLAREGYAALSVREIARDAGVNFALIHYHFESKDQLVLAVLDEANRRLLERQQRMYRAPGGYAEKWAQARRFYENDLASGFVRVLMELYAASMSNTALREQFRPRILAWFEVIHQVAREAFQEYALDLPVSPEVVACWISNFWIGMELAMLTGTGDARLHEQALDAFEAMLRRMDARGRAGNEAPTKEKGRAPAKVPARPKVNAAVRKRAAPRPR